MRETHTAQSSIFDFYSQHEFGDFLRRLSAQVDNHPQILTLVEKDLLTEKAKPTGRKGLSAESVFRCMLLKQITGVSYKMLAFHLSDSQSYRAFARLDRNSSPVKSALSGNIRRLKPETLEAVFKVLAVKAFDDGYVEAEVLRMDSTVVQSHISPPLDSQLLDDGIRVLSRYFAKSQGTTGVKLRLTDHRKASRSLAARIFYGKKAEKAALYEQLIPLAWKVVTQSDNAIEQVQSRCCDKEKGRKWIESVVHYRELLKVVIDQTQRRVFNGEDVPATEKLVSLFEPHTDIIVKGERSIEYGHKVNLASDRNGLITSFSIEKGNPADTTLFVPLIKQHQALYGCLPTTTIADGGYASADNIKVVKALGVKQVAFHKKNGLGLQAMGIKAKTLKKLKDFRAGIEGNISELKRAFGTSRVLWKGEDGFLSSVWASVISYNLTRLVRLNSG
jgi:IS5 family transposase